MRRGRHRIFTDAECAELWRMYKSGESILGIGRALGRGGTAVHRVLQSTGGIAPALRRRSSRVLSLVEREEISRGIAAGCTIRAIARGLSDQGGPKATHGVASIADLGPRSGTCEPCAIHCRHGRTGLFLRSVEPLAARQQREYEWAAAPVLSEGHGLVCCQPGAARYRGSKAKYATPRDPSLEDTGVYAWCQCFDDPLRPLTLSG
jgi:hypothetical protein